MAVKMANQHTKLFNSIRYHRIVNNNKKCDTDIYPPEQQNEKVR